MLICPILDIFKDTLYNRFTMNVDLQVARLEKEGPKRVKGANAFLLVILSFIIVILIGSLLLYLPLSASKDSSVDWSHWGGAGYYLNCLFVATSATCVTGLNTFSNGLAGTFNFFGQLVVLIMIQIGGLGFITVLSFFLTLFAHRVKFKNRLFLAQATGSTSFGQVVNFVRKIIVISFIVELMGTLLVFPAFYEIAKLSHPTTAGAISAAIWPSIFHSISSFNNAGFDIMGSTSLLRLEGTVFSQMPTWAYNYLLVVTMVLIVLGGISFLVIIDVFSFKGFKQYKVFTKIVLVTTGFLLAVGTLLFILFDCFKGEGSMTPLDALFQSVTCRTAGFATYNQADLSIGGRITSCVLMFIGGSPLGTAGGIKTTTIFMVFLALFSYLRGKDVAAFKRQYSPRMVIKAMSVVTIAIIVVITAYGAISAIESTNNASVYEDGERASTLFFECFSAFGTVGLTANLTPSLRWGSKIIICILMFLGRLGPMTMFQVFQQNMDKKSKLHYSFVEEDFLIG